MVNWISSSICKLMKSPSLASLNKPRNLSLFKMRSPNVVYFWNWYTRLEISSNFENLAVHLGRREKPWERGWTKIYIFLYPHPMPKLMRRNGLMDSMLECWTSRWAVQIRVQSIALSSWKYKCQADDVTYCLLTVNQVKPIRIFYSRSM